MSGQEDGLIEIDLEPSYVKRPQVCSNRHLLAWPDVSVSISLRCSDLRTSLRTVAASVTRMVIFVQATALRYDVHLDFECRFAHFILCLLPR